MSLPQPHPSPSARRPHAARVRFGSTLFPLSPLSPLALLIAALFPAGQALAQATAPQENLARLDEVLITAPAERPLPATAASLKADELRARRAASSDTASLLRDVPGVSLQGAGGVSSLPVIHGLADDRVRTKIDGMDLIASCPNHMNPALAYLDPSQVEAVQVYAGISPVSVGGDSIGGSIVVESSRPVFAQPGEAPLFKGEVGAHYRSNGHAQGANLNASYATETFSLNVSSALAKADNYRAGGDFKSSTVTGRAGHELARDEVGSTAYETRNHALNLAWKIDNHLIEAKLGYQDLPLQLYPNQRMDMLNNEQTRLNLRYLGAFDWGSLEARLYHEEVDHFMDFGADKRYWYGSNSGMGAVATPCAPLRFMGDPAGTCAAGMAMYSASKNTGARLKAEIQLTEQDLLRVGGEWQDYRLDDWWPASGGGMGPFAFQNINQGKRQRQALFGELEKQLDTQWQLLGGLRYEAVKTSAAAVHGYNLASAPLTGSAGAMNQTGEAVAFNNAARDKTDHNWDATLLARYTANATHSIEFGYAHKTRSPNLYERYTWSTAGMMATMNNFVGDGNGYVGNLLLKPEQADTLAATFDWHAADRSWEFKATPHYTRVKDYVDAVKTATWNPGKFNVLRYANQSARLYGLDLSGHVSLAQTAYGKFGLKGRLDYTHGKNRDTGDDLYNIMPLNTRLTLTHQHGGWDNAVELVAVKAKNDVSDVRNEIKTPGYGIVNLRGSYAWKQVRLDFGIENLFDRHYTLPLGGAYLGQGRTMSINPTDGTLAWGTAVPGMGRSLYTGINLKF
ncbi:MAG: TonB-dependent receptor [Sterolibacterium sp.]|nr:TonB-dependent receptor [Sterolibacterium sp.]